MKKKTHSHSNSFSASTLPKSGLASVKKTAPRPINREGEEEKEEEEGEENSCGACPSGVQHLEII